MINSLGKIIISVPLILIVQYALHIGGILFTGKYPSQTKVTSNGHELPIGEKILADYFNEAGYQTAYVGKWHLSSPPGCNRWVPEDKRGGFQEAESPAN